MVRAVHGERGSGRRGGAGSGAGGGPVREPVDLLHLGRRTRSIPPALRRALDLRDRGCRFPGCGLRFTDAHHIVHWAHGGETSLANTLLLCRHHHRLVHEGGWSVRNDHAGGVVFVDPRGSELRGGDLRSSEFRPSGVPSSEFLVADHRQRGIVPGPTTPSSRWRREADIPAEVQFRAMEALD